MKKTMTTFILIAGMSFIAFQNCSNKSYSAANGDAATTADETTDDSDTTSDSGSSTISCAEQLQSVTVPVKMLFIVDTSGSNADDYIYSGTDSDKSLRGGSIDEFFAEYKVKDNFSWGFITFSGISATSLIGSDSSPTFTSSVTTMSSAISNFYKISDYGGTPYVAALDLAAKAVTNDTTYSSTDKYVVIFLSDGVPDPVVADDVLASKVKNVLAQHSGQVTFNTVYYGPTSSSASSRLRAMAGAGNGQFLDVSSASAQQSFKIEDVAQVAGTTCSE